MYIKTGEKEHDYPLEWDQIASSDYDAKKYAINNKVIKKSQARVKKNETFKLIEENARRWEKQRESKVYPLSFEDYKTKEELEKTEGEKFKVLKDLTIEGFEVNNVQADLATINAEESRIKRNKDWIKSILKDPYVYESLQIIEDLN